MTLRSLKSTRQMYFIKRIILNSENGGYLENTAAILDCQVAHRADVTSSPQRTFVLNLVIVSQFARLVPLSAPLLSNTLNWTAQTEAASSKAQQTLGVIRGFAKLNKFQKSKKTWIELTPPTHPPPPPSKLCFGNQSLTWTEHSNHNN